MRACADRSPGSQNVLVSRLVRTGGDGKRETDGIRTRDILDHNQVL